MVWQLFTIEMGRERIVTFYAGNAEEADMLASSPEFRAHLASHTAWNGRDTIYIRDAFPDELEIWATIFEANGEPQRRCLVWLVPLSNPGARRSPN
jgi:hypothetical protein